VQEVPQAACNHSGTIFEDSFTRTQSQVEEAMVDSSQDLLTVVIEASWKLSRSMKSIFGGKVREESGVDRPATR
jgi:hypothetical protein